MRRIKHLRIRRRRNLAFERSLLVVNPHCGISDPATVDGAVNGLPFLDKRLDSLHSKASQNVARVWPQIIEMTEQRNAAIQEFARQRGWTATIVDPGVTVTFRKGPQLSN